MDSTVRFLLGYGYLLLFVVVLAEQIGLPIPAVPVLLGVGALAGIGRMHLVIGKATPASACWTACRICFSVNRLVRVVPPILFRESLRGPI